MQFRHEWKHEINYGDQLALRARLGAVLEPDPHAQNGSYQIRSLYFDTPEDKALREKLEGVSRREKFRLRYYDRDPSRVLLEKKSKLGGLCSKEQTLLTPGEVRAILEGSLTPEMAARHPLLGELEYKTTTQRLEPKTIVDYARDPFVYGPGNVRVTLDYDLRAGLDPQDFLDPDCPTLPVFAGPVILEVKWDEFLPDLVRDLCQLEGRRTSAFSKYAACRVYG